MTTSIIKLCVYSLDKDYNFVGLGTTEHECIKPSDKESFKLDFSFFAVNSLIRPIPYGMHLIGIIRSSKNPNAAGKVHKVYDLYNTMYDSTQTYFMAYVMPVIGTKILYIWENPELDSSYLTFDKNYKPDSINWQESILSPLYVFESRDISFSCNNFRCLPYSDKNVFDQGIKYDSYSECLAGCALKGRFIDNLLTVPTMLDVIQNPKSEITENYENTCQKPKKDYNRILLTVFITLLCVVILVAIFYCIYRK